MKPLKSKIIYHGGSLPVPSYRQKGEIRLENDRLVVHARGDAPRYDIDVEIPLNRLVSVRAEEQKYYSSVGYFLMIDYCGDSGETENLELEIRSFIRRGRAQAYAHHWVKTLQEATGKRPSAVLPDGPGGCGVP